MSAAILAGWHNLKPNDALRPSNHNPFSEHDKIFKTQQISETWAANGVIITT